MKQDLARGIRSRVRDPLGIVHMFWDTSIIEHMWFASCAAPHDRDARKIFSIYDSTMTTDPISCLECIALGDAA